MSKSYWYPETLYIYFWRPLIGLLISFSWGILLRRQGYLTEESPLKRFLYANVNVIILKMTSLCCLFLINFPYIF